ncbi:MAG TPA: formate--tetrahydrofolate ligase, partial [Gemmatimonadaceae bacterium]
MSFPTDIEIAQAAKPRHIRDVAAEIGLGEDDLDLYGKYKAKIPLEISQRPVKGRLVLVTAVNPTPAGEGKSTVTVGLTQALRRLGAKALLCMREPSLGPVFGVKGGAAGYSYVVYGPLANGATSLMFEGVPNFPTSSRFWEVCDKHKVEIFYTAPTALRALMREGDGPVQRTSRKSIRLLGTVGEPINPEAWLWYHRV